MHVQVVAGAAAAAKAVYLAVMADEHRAALNAYDASKYALKSCWGKATGLKTFLMGQQVGALKAAIIAKAAPDKASGNNTNAAAGAPWGSATDAATAAGGHTATLTVAEGKTIACIRTRPESARMYIASGPFLPKKDSWEDLLQPQVRPLLATPYVKCGTLKLWQMGWHAPSWCCPQHGRNISILVAELAAVACDCLQPYSLCCRAMGRRWT
jgi:hypothetical protein